jgi:hypothetical protein
VTPDPRLDRYVEVGECHEWTGPYDAKSPVFKTGPKTYSVRRLVWQEAGRTVEKGRVIYAAVCLNNSCVRLDHLAEGPAGIQLRVRAQAGLMKHSPSTIANLTLAARARSQTVCTPEKARQCRDMNTEGRTRQEICEATGLTKAVVSDILGGRAWLESVTVSSVFNWRPIPAPAPKQNTAQRYKTRKAA